MKQYTIENKKYRIIEGELWLRLESDVDEQRKEPTSSSHKEKRVYQKRKPTQAKTKSRGKITDEAKRKMLEDHECGVSMKEICKKYGISAPTFYNIRSQFKKAKGIEYHYYECQHCKEQFKSNLKENKARCPKCGSPDTPSVSKNDVPNGL